MSVFACWVFNIKLVRTALNSDSSDHVPADDQLSVTPKKTHTRKHTTVIFRKKTKCFIYVLFSTSATEPRKLDLCMPSVFPS